MYIEGWVSAENLIKLKKTKGKTTLYDKKRKLYGACCTLKDSTLDDDHKLFLKEIEKIKSLYKKITLVAKCPNDNPRYQRIIKRGKIKLKGVRK